MMQVSMLSLSIAALLLAPSHGFVVTPSSQRSTPLLMSQKDKTDHAYHKGGNAKFHNPVVQPARLNVEGVEEEECEDVMIDFATGDELCWNEAPTHPRNVVEQKKSKKGDWVERAFVNPDVADDYHKGGNAKYEPKGTPSKLDDDDCETPFMDFATGDELCWNDYDKSRF